MKKEKSVNKTELKKISHYHDVIDKLIDDESNTVDKFFDYVDRVDKLIEKSHEANAEKIADIIENDMDSDYGNKWSEKLNEYNLEAQGRLTAKSYHLNYLACKNLLQYLSNPLVKANKKNHVPKKQIQQLKKDMKADRNEYVKLEAIHN